MNQKAIKAKLLGELNENDFKVMKASIDRETQQIQAQIAALDAETSSMTALTQQPMKKLSTSIVGCGSSDTQEGDSNCAVFRGFSV